MVPGTRAPKPESAWLVRPARPEDAAAIVAIYNDAVRSTTATFDTEPRSLADQLAWLAVHDADHPVLVAESNRELTGWAALSPWSDRRAYARTAESSIYVGAEWRGRGIGRDLLRELVSAGRARGLHSILARVADGNAVSTRLHRSAGFVSIGIMREVGYKFGRLLDVELMQLLLGEPGADTTR